MVVLLLVRSRRRAVRLLRGDTGSLAMTALGSGDVILTGGNNFAPGGTTDSVGGVVGRSSSSVGPWVALGVMIALRRRKMAIASPRDLHTSVEVATGMSFSVG
jgi:hypothetical protein